MEKVNGFNNTRKDRKNVKLNVLISVSYSILDKIKLFTQY